MQVMTHLDFDGLCEEAVTFYCEAVGAEVKFLMRYKDSPQPIDPGVMPEGMDDKIFHMSFRIGETELHAGDEKCGGRPDFRGFVFLLRVPSLTEGQAKFAALSDGGEVLMPMAETFWSPGFGMVRDRFGLTWKVQVSE